VSIDDAVRNYLTFPMRYGNALGWMQRRFADFNTFVTTGFLPAGVPRGDAARLG
jgi:hypothetical protein